MPKVKKDKSASRNVPLADQIVSDRQVRPSASTKDRAAKRKEAGEEFVDAKLSGRILAQARAQQEELEAEHGPNPNAKRDKVTSISLGQSEDPDDEVAVGTDTDSELEEEDEYAGSNAPSEVDSDEEKALEKFMSKAPQARRTLADVIRDALNEKKTEMQSAMSGYFVESQSQQPFVSGLDERMESMYKQIGMLLSKYRSGPMPKAFKVIPYLRNWEQVLYVTKPDSWTAAAVYMATRIFISNLNAKMAQRYVNIVLLPRVRDDITEYKRLNVHLYNAVKRSLFKPQAFFKGFLLPLCEAGDCTLREAVLVASVLTKCSIPMLHSAAALMKIAEMEYTGANSIFLRSLLDKKYALPYRVVDAVVHHFLGFRTDTRVLPVLWHQSLLVFAQRYKSDVSSEQKEALLELLKTQKHGKITPEIRRELQGAQARDVEEEGAAALEFMNS